MRAPTCATQQSALPNPSHALPHFIAPICAFSQKAPSTQSNKNLIVHFFRNMNDKQEICVTKQR
jgi:hypothetical protein